ncbi:MAG: glutamate 5-kinase [Candidatus Omnitrophota bacterium]
MSRKFPRKIKRLVIKIGSTVIATYRMKPKKARLSSLAQEIASVSKNGVEVVLVSSGAIVLGMGELNRSLRPTDLATLQATAAVGQNVLMQTYSQLFKKNKIKCAQILLTWDDFDNRHRFNNARNTLQAILENGIVPIVNENDTISTDEIKFGDNDRLSALVASMIQADLLLILSDVEGLYDIKNGKKKLFREIKEITKEIEGMVCADPSKKHISQGGMAAKLEAVKVAAHAKIPCIIANGETPQVLTRILKGERIGTFFMEKEDKLLSRKHWISFGAKPKGVITIDDGAKEALLLRGKSLLLPGIIRWDGNFKVDDVVIVNDKEGQEIARGIVHYSIVDLYKAEDKHRKQEVIHCDNLVFCQR